jgi:excisionase family DNA binding protein
MQFPTLLTARETAPLLDVALRTLHRRAAAGKVPHYVIGEQRRFDEAEIRALAAGGAK